MAIGQTECPRCGGEMEAGLSIDAPARGGYSDQQWLEGAAERSIWTGLKTKGKHRLHVVTYRCTKCGYLESYANESAE